MELRQLEYFLVLCKELHFTKAAEKLNISQPTLSHQIKVLENELGIPLFDRLGKKIAITEAGKILYDQTVRIFRSIENAKNQISELKELKTGNLVVGTVPVELTEMISGYLLDYYRKYPGIHVCIKSSEDLLNLLRENKIDFAVSYKKEDLDYEEEQLEVIPLFKEDLLVVAHKDHPLSAFESIPFEEVLKHELILFPKNYQCKKLIDSAARKRNLHVKTKIETASVQTIFQLVEENIGATILSKSVCSSYQSPVLCNRPISDPPLTREIVLLYRKNKFISFAAKAFIQLMKEKLAESGLLTSEQSLQMIDSLIEKQQ